MPSGNWSFPCSPRNPAKIREELRLLRSLASTWRDRGLIWSPRTGPQLEFGRHLRASGDAPLARDAVPTEAGEDLRFRRQASALSDDNLRWTARARFGTYKFFGFVTHDPEGFASLTPAGEDFVASPRPGDVLLRQLLKWQYPDYQHRGSRWPATDFSIFPFVATARLVLELEGLTREEIALFCFTMRRTEEVAATAERIHQFRAQRGRAFGRTGKARTVHAIRETAMARYEAEGRRVVLGSTHDYADALVRSFRYTGLFSVRGSRLVVASGRAPDVEALVYQSAGVEPALLAPSTASAARTGAHQPRSHSN